MGYNNENTTPIHLKNSASIKHKTTYFQAFDSGVPKPFFESLKGANQLISGYSGRHTQNTIQANRQGTDEGSHYRYIIFSSSSVV